MEPARTVMPSTDRAADVPAATTLPTARPVRLSWPRRVLLGVLALAVLGIVAASLRPRPEPPLQVQLATARTGPITRKVTAAGKLQAATMVKVSSNISGDLLELAVKEGDRVTRGQLIARIEARRYAAQVKQQEALRGSASAELAAERVVIERLRQELQRVQRLARGGNASVAEVERAQADVDTEIAKANAAQERIAQAEAALADARQLPSFATIYAPIDGVVVTRSKQAGERVRGSDLSEDPIVTIATLASMEAKVEVGEQEVVFVHEGDAAEVEVDAFPDRKFPATVIEVAKNANVKNAGTEAEVTTFFVRMALTGPTAGALPGMSGQATIATERHDKAVVVPIQAVTVRSERDLQAKPGKEEAGAPPPEVAGQAGAAARDARRGQLRKVVFVVEQGVARARVVETGLASESDIEIVSGVKDGDVLVAGPYRLLSRDLRDGKRVERAKEEPAAGEKRP